MTLDVEKIKAETKRISLTLDRKDILAVGLFGSLARGDYHARSDIDIFIITEKETSLAEELELYRAFRDLRALFAKDTTVLVYDLTALKQVPSWHTLHMMKDACFLVDRAGVHELFKKILKQAEEKGIIYDEKDRVFRLRRPGRMVFTYEEKP